MKLTPRQQRFVEAYSLEPNATRAALAAGYSKRTAPSQGARLLKNANVAAELQKRGKAREAKALMTADERAEVLDAIIKGERGEPTTNLAGEVIGMGPPKLKDVLKAIDLRNKMDGCYVQRHEGAVGLYPMAPPAITPGDASAELRRRLGKGDE